MQWRVGGGRVLPASTLHSDTGVANSDAGVPIVVAAEAAIAGASLLVVAIFAYLRPSLLRVFWVAAWMLGGGRRHLECKLAEAGVPDVGLPLNPQLIAFADRAFAEGRSVYLAVARQSPLLEAAVSRCPSIAGVIVEPSARGRRMQSEWLRDRFPGGYDAIVGRTALLAIAGAGGSMQSAATVPENVPQTSVLRELAKSLRLHQCVKNSIVFVPVLLGGRLTDLTEIILAFVAFIALSLVASGTYVLNDIWDIADDRKHWSKRERPIASGRLSAATAVTVAFSIIAAGILLGMLISWKTGMMLLLYLAVTLLYTVRLKTAPFVDGLTLAALFTIRLGIGAAAASVPPSPWLFVFSMFLFSSLSYAKRHTEIARAIVHQSKEVNGRGYRLVDAPMVLTVGLSAGIAAVVIMVLYIVEEAFRSSFYGSTSWLWGFPPLIFLFVMRIWLVSARGEMNDDPVDFAIRDRLCILLLSALLVCFGFAWLG